MVNEEDDRRIFADEIYEDKGGGMSWTSKNGMMKKQRERW